MAVSIDVGSINGKLEYLYQQARKSKSGPVWDRLVGIYDAAYQQVETGARASGEASTLTGDQKRERAWQLVHDEFLNTASASAQAAAGAVGGDSMLKSGLEIFGVISTFFSGGIIEGVKTLANGGGAMLGKAIRALKDYNSPENTLEGGGHKKGFGDFWKKIAGEDNVRKWVEDTFGVKGASAQDNFLAELESAPSVPVGKEQVVSVAPQQQAGAAGAGEKTPTQPAPAATVAPAADANSSAVLPQAQANVLANSVVLTAAKTPANDDSRYNLTVKSAGKDAKGHFVVTAEDAQHRLYKFNGEVNGGALVLHSGDRVKQDGEVLRNLFSGDMSVSAGNFSPSTGSPMPPEVLKTIKNMGKL